MRYFAMLMMILLGGCSDSDNPKTSGETLDFWGEHSETTSDINDTIEVSTSSAADEGGDTDSDRGDSDDTLDDTMTDTDSSIFVDTDSARSDSTDTGEDPDQLTTTECLERTPDEETCLDCCDCKNNSCEDRAMCRDACASVDFAQNSNYVTFDVPSIIGSAGDYMDCFMRGEEQSCKACCDCSTIYVCGDYAFCRVACESIF